MMGWSRNDVLAITLPLWAKQRNVDYEVIVAKGPEAVIPDLPHVRTIDADHCCIPHAINKAIAAAKGDVVVITQADMELNSDNHLFNMYQKLKPGHMVSHKHFNEGRRHSGIYCHCLMVYKNDLVAVGGFDEFYCILNKSYAFEDSALVTSLLERGVLLDFHTADIDHSMHHIAHPRPDCSSKEVMEMWKKARNHYVETHPIPLLALYAKQFLGRHGMRADQLDNIKVSTDTEAAVHEWQSRLIKESK